MIGTFISLNYSCPTCFSPDNIAVKYYSKKHVCINCRKFLRDQHGNQVKLFVSKEGDIVCLGIYKMTDEHLKLQEEQFNNRNPDNNRDPLNDKNADKMTSEEEKLLKNQKAWKKIDHKVYYQTDFMKLSWNGKSAFVTFAGED